MDILVQLDLSIIEYIVETVVATGLACGTIITTTLSLVGLGIYKAICLVDIKR